MKLNRSHWTALFIAVALTGWLASGRMVSIADGNAPPPAAEPPKEKPAKPLQRVRVRNLSATEIAHELVIHGHTAPARTVTVRAETDGRVEEVSAERGAAVTAGQLLVRLDPRDRRERLEQARSLLEQRRIEYQAARKLHKENLRAESQLAEARALLDAAQAQQRAVELDLAYLELRAPFAGRLEERAVELGDFLQSGDPVAEVVELSPLIVTGQVTEQEVAGLRRGLAGRATLVTGQEAVGTLRYVAALADPETRSFTVELELANPDGELPAGVTAVVRVELERLAAHRVSPALLALDDDGRLGVKTVDETGTVRFHRVRIVRSDTDAVWLAGLPEQVRLITVGQGFVTTGQKVEVVEEEA